MKNCFESIENIKLRKAFESKIKEGMSREEIVNIGTELVVKEFNALNKELHKLSASVGHKYELKPVVYTPIEKPTVVAKPVTETTPKKEVVQQKETFTDTEQAEKVNTKKATNKKDLATIYKEDWGMSKQEADAAAVVSDLLIGTKAEREGISKEEMYGKIDWRKGGEGLGEDALFQGDYTEVINGFYSPLEKIIGESKQDKLPAKQWIEKFARGDEAKWTGLTDWLNKQQGSVSKSDIQKFLKENRIEIKEVQKGDGFVITDIENDKQIKTFDEYEDAVDFVNSQKKLGNNYSVITSIRQYNKV